MCPPGGTWLYCDKKFGEFVQSSNSPNFFLNSCSKNAGRGEPLPYGADRAKRLFCNTPISFGILPVPVHGEGVPLHISFRTSGIFFASITNGKLSATRIRNSSVSRSSGSIFSGSSPVFSTIPMSIGWTK